ncbi:DUF1289 domain-containing protein [Methylomonas sp. MgM2]
MIDDTENIPSPCIRNCCLDKQDVCLGCFRTLREICDWSKAGNEQRREILVNAKHRRLQRTHLAQSSEIDLKLNGF